MENITKAVASSKKPTGPELDALIEGVVNSTFKADEVVAEAGASRRDLAVALNKIWGFDWFEITQPSNDTTDEGKTVRLKQKKLYGLLDEGAKARGQKEYSNRSKVWNDIKKYGRDDRYPPVESDAEPKDKTHKDRAVERNAVQWRSIDRDEKASKADIEYKDGIRDLVLKCYGIDIKEVK